MAAEQAWREFLTEEEYWSLGTDGRMQMRYWAEFLPKMCREMAAKGTLLQTIRERDEYLGEKHEELLNSGMPEDAALEFIKEDVYSLKMEADEVDPECLEMELEYQWAHSRTKLSFEEWKKKPENIAYAKELLRY